MTKAERELLYLVCQLLFSIINWGFIPKVDASKLVKALDEVRAENKE